MGGTEGAALKNIQVPYAKHSLWEVAAAQLSQALCDNLRGGAVVGAGRRAQGEGT